jgi:hypothetical protein
MGNVACAGTRKEPSAMRPASESSQSRLSAPACASAGSEEPTLTTMRRKSLSDGVFDMVPADVVGCAGGLAWGFQPVMSRLKWASLAVPANSAVS